MTKKNKYIFKIKPNIKKVLFFILAVSFQLALLFTINNDFFGLIESEKIVLVQFAFNFFIFIIYMVTMEFDTKSEEEEEEEEGFFLYILKLLFFLVPFLIVVAPVQFLLYNNYETYFTTNLVLITNLISWLLFIFYVTKDETKRIKKRVKKKTVFNSVKIVEIEKYNDLTIFFVCLWYLLGLIQIFLLIPSLKHYFQPLEKLTILDYFFSAKSILAIVALSFLLIIVIIRLIDNKFEKIKIPRIKYFNNYSQNTSGFLSEFVQSLKYIINILIKIINPIIAFISLLLIYIFYIIPFVIVKNILIEFAELSIHIFKSIIFLLLILIFGYIISTKSELLFDYFNSNLYQIGYDLFFKLIFIFCTLLILFILFQLIDNWKTKLYFGKLPFVLLYFIFTSTVTGLIYKFITGYEFGVFIYLFIFHLFL